MFPAFLAAPAFITNLERTTTEELLPVVSVLLPGGSRCERRPAGNTRMKLAELILAWLAVSPVYTVRLSEILSALKDMPQTAAEPCFSPAHAARCLALGGESFFCHLLSLSSSPSLAKLAPGLCHGSHQQTWLWMIVKIND